MKNTVIRINSTPEYPRAYYVGSVSKDGGFSIAFDKDHARKFTPATAREVIARIARPDNTRMQFDTCEVQA